MKKKAAGILIGILAAAGTLAGCAARQPAQEEEEKDLITVGFSQVGAESDWRIANTESMKEALSEENGFELIVSDAQQKQENQTKAIRDFISQEVDVIVLAPVTEDGWETVLEEAKEAEIPVIVMDRMIDVDDPSLYTCWVGSDFKQEGIDAANWLVSYMEEQGRGDEQHNIVVLKGTIGSSAQIGRSEGFNETIVKYRNYKILTQQNGEFTQARGRKAMEECLEEYQDIDVVVSQNDNMSFGVIQALKAAGKKPGEDVVIISFDAVRAAFEAMIRGELNVCIECNPLHGPKVAELAKKIVAGEKVDKVQYMEEGIYPAETAEQELPNRKY